MTTDFFQGGRNAHLIMSTYTTNTKTESKFEDVPEEVLTDPTMRTALGMDPIPGMNTPVDDNKQISMFDYMQNKNNSSTSSSTTTTAAPEVTVFKNLVHPEFGELRTVEIDGEPWFVGKDVATALGYCNINKAVAAHVDEDDKKVLDFKGFSQNGKSSGLWVGHDFSSKTIINESGLYSLILSSKLPSAKDVAEWIGHSQPSVMLKSIDDEEKVKVNNIHFENRTGGNGTWFLTEDGLYEVLMQSRKPIAKSFKKKVKEILKSIRKNGAYIRNLENMTPAEIVAHGLIAAQKIIEEREKGLDH